MNYLVDEKTLVYFPTVARYKREVHFKGISKYDQPDGSKTWFEEWNYNTSEHVGTHIDAPVHFGKNGPGNRWYIEDIPFERFIGPAVVVDVSDKADIDTNVDYGATIEDIQEYERLFGTIPSGAILLIHTGWGKYWGDQVKYAGTDTRDDKKAHFPSLSPEAAQWIADDGRIVGVGVDTSSCDTGDRLDTAAHVNLFEKNVYCLENVANLRHLPQKGATIYVMPIPIKGGSGAPSRVYATWDDGQSSAACTSKGVLALFLIALILAYRTQFLFI
ncbi:unnamed protein product [Owenia fusiformis]|uniref:Cyclase n=1 Tax=Owenia fusiformis TaxID=6347 RepID=A0A8S4NDZ6_OWEFU|nr:unnamed protein product [Owenia fusiformis]